MTHRRFDLVLSRGHIVWTQLVGLHLETGKDQPNEYGRWISNGHNPDVRGPEYSIQRFNLKPVEGYHNKHKQVDPYYYAYHRGMQIKSMGGKREFSRQEDAAAACLHHHYA